MKESKFTAGPWILLQHRKKVFIQGRLDSAYFSIAEVGGPSNPTTDAIKERIANVNLIAAAPEMYEALKDILAHWRIADEDMFASDLATDAIAALRKAEGA
jgi:hypothetical protein